ncbi:MAG TPA: tRNA lysidine(34) synthetase TilS [Casimicrobiaceae bacterium]|nr:tRNA lysidine(34) synthetase TilS [Casimicrobiaceae bacterium]
MAPAAIDSGKRDSVETGSVRGAVAGALATAMPRGGRIAVALSGGRDSVVLLDAAVAVADPLFEVLAFHVEHGLSPNARAWARFCTDLCAARAVPCHVERVRVARGPRISVEAAAREARYAAVAALAAAHGVRAVLLAHHADDQAETALLQLLRGAGPRGLAAMPAARYDGRVHWLRPFLDLPRARIEAYAQAQSVAFVDDESNADPRYRRNALRRDVVPALRAIAPGYPSALVRAASLQGEAAALLDDLAAIDARSGYDGVALDRATLAALDDVRARNLLRWFLRQRGLPAPSHARLAAMLRQLVHADADARVLIRHAGAAVGMHRGRIVVHQAECEPFARGWDGADSVALPHGTLTLVPGFGRGIAARHLNTPGVTIRSGVDGERLALAGRAARRPVAELLREAGIPHWERRGLPRIYCGDTLAAVAPLGVDAAFAAAPGEPARDIVWQPVRIDNHGPARA